MLAQILTNPISGASVWNGRDFLLEKTTVTFNENARQELLEFVEHLRQHPLSTSLLDPNNYNLPFCRKTCDEIAHLVFNGPKFCLVNGLPIEEISTEEATACYWLISSIICRPVAQKLDATMIYDVLNTDLKAQAGSGVRPDKTNIDLTFHNDNSYNVCMPEVVGLLCLKQARSGGLSRLMSFDTIYNELLQRSPEVLPRLYRPFWFDRQREHYPNEDPTFSAPILVNDNGKVKVRLGLHQVRSAYLMRGETLDEEGQKAIKALETILSDPDLYISFSMTPGQIQFAHNLSIGHSRTHFEDFEEPDRKRHLVRLWMRNYGLTSYTGKRNGLT